MSLFLKKVQNSRWTRPSPAPWLPEHDVPADCFVDLESKDCRLSVWTVTEDRSNLERIVAALSGTRQYVQNFDYALIGTAVVERLGIIVLQCPGDTADREANERWHYDLVELTGEKLLALARAISLRGERDRFYERDIESFLRRGINEGKLTVEGLKLKSEARKRLGL